MFVHPVMCVPVVKYASDTSHLLFDFNFLFSRHIRAKPILWFKFHFQYTKVKSSLSLWSTNTLSKSHQIRWLDCHLTPISHIFWNASSWLRMFFTYLQAYHLFRDAVSHEGINYKCYHFKEWLQIIMVLDRDETK